MLLFQIVLSLINKKNYEVSSAQALFKMWYTNIKNARKIHSYEHDFKIISSTETLALTK